MRAELKETRVDSEAATFPERHLRPVARSATRRRLLLSGLPLFGAGRLVGLLSRLLPSIARHLLGLLFCLPLFFALQRGVRHCHSQQYGYETP